MLKIAKRMILLIAVAGAAVAAVAQSQQSINPPLDEQRLSIHTLVREDIFAGFLKNDAERIARGEKNIDALMASRPSAKAELLSWKGGIGLYRAVRAFEKGNREEFDSYYKASLDNFAQAKQLGPENGGVFAVLGGSHGIFADRLPKEYRKAAWDRAYEAYLVLWKQQAPAVDQLPVHLKGELLAGLAQSAQRTGHTEEMAKYVDKILQVLPDTPYERVAKQWKADPASAADSSMTCMSCHDAGRLAPRMAALK